MQGTLTVKPICAKINRDKDILGKMDPFVVLTLGTQSFKTAACSGGGKNPTWTDVCTFKLTHEKQINFEVYDKDPIKDELIGVGTIELGPLLAKKNDSAWYNIHKAIRKDGKIMRTNTTGVEGQILIETELIPEGHAYQRNFGYAQVEGYTYPYQGYPPQQGYPYQGYPPQQGYPNPGQYPPHGYHPMGGEPHGYGNKPVYGANTSYYGTSGYGVNQAPGTTPVQGVTPGRGGMSGYGVNPTHGSTRSYDSYYK